MQLGASDDGRYVVLGNVGVLAEESIYPDEIRESLEAEPLLETETEEKLETLAETDMETEAETETKDVQQTQRKSEPASGNIYKGEKFIGAHWYYFDESMGVMATSWTEHHGNHYYYNSNGEMVYGEQVIDGQTYYFNTITGALAYDNHWIVIPDLYGNGIITFNGMNALSPERQQRLNDAIYVITGKGYNVGFVMVDLFTGKGISYNGNQNYYSASPIKGP